MKFQLRSDGQWYRRIPRKGANYWRKTIPWDASQCRLSYNSYRSVFRKAPSVELRGTEEALRLSAKKPSSPKAGEPGTGRARRSGDHKVSPAGYSLVTKRCRLCCFLGNSIESQYRYF